MGESAWTLEVVKGRVAGRSYALGGPETILGNALGGGLQISLGADIRIVAPDARLSVFEVVWGLVPDMTGSQLLPELVGRDDLPCTPSRTRRAIKTLGT